MTRTAVVTGAGSGLGRAIVEEFLADDWQVIGVDRDPRSETDGLVQFESVDLSDPGAAVALLSRLSEVGDVHALVNNAAMQVNEPLVETSDETWDAVMATNLRIVFQLIRGLHPQLAQARGAVVNIGSVHSVATSINVAAYAVSKAALAGLTRSAALELGPSGIRCNAVLPGAIDTPMLRDGLDRRPHPDGPEGNLADLGAKTPLGFVARPEHIAPSVLHLADGERSPYTTGQLLVVDGGATLRLGTE